MANAVYYEGTWTVPAGSELMLPLQAEYLHVISASQSTFGLTLGDDAPGIGRPGANFRTQKGRHFEAVRVLNLNAVEVLILTLGYGRGDFSLMQFKSIPASTLTTKPDASIPAGAAALVAAANPNRRRAVIANPFGNAREFRVGDVTVGAARGVEIPPGESIYLDTTAAIYAFNPDGAPQNISVLEIAE